MSWIFITFVVLVTVLISPALFIASALSVAIIREVLDGER